MEEQLEEIMGSPVVAQVAREQEYILEHLYKQP